MSLYQFCLRNLELSLHFLLLSHKFSPSLLLPLTLFFYNMSCSLYNVFFSIVFFYSCRRCDLWLSYYLFFSSLLLQNTTCISLITSSFLLQFQIFLTRFNLKPISSYFSSSSSYCVGLASCIYCIRLHLRTRARAHTHTHLQNSSRLTTVPLHTDLFLYLTAHHTTYTTDKEPKLSATCEPSIQASEQL